ncbi:hypothetical protein C3B79_1566 [Aeromonas hydrophila]|nr:hypothetical protein C3B79_1566 [Aeromonas hydrophila]
MSSSYCSKNLSFFNKKRLNKYRKTINIWLYLLINDNSVLHVAHPFTPRGKR